MINYARRQNMNVHDIYFIFYFIISALDTSNIAVKDQIFRLLSALTFYSEDGLHMTLLSLDNYKVVYHLE